MFRDRRFSATQLSDEKKFPNQQRRDLTLPNCSKYCFTSSTTVLADNPPTNIFFVLVTIWKRREDKRLSLCESILVQTSKRDNKESWRTLRAKKKSSERIAPVVLHWEQAEVAQCVIGSGWNAQRDWLTPFLLDLFVLVLHLDWTLILLYTRAMNVTVVKRTSYCAKTGTNTYFLSAKSNH